jgi:hypothetical protein
VNAAIAKLKNTLREFNGETKAQRETKEWQTAVLRRTGVLAAAEFAGNAAFVGAAVVAAPVVLPVMTGSSVSTAGIFLFRAAVVGFEVYSAADRAGMLED